MKAFLLQGQNPLVLVPPFFRPITPVTVGWSKELQADKGLPVYANYLSPLPVTSLFLKTPPPHTHKLKKILNYLQCNSSWCREITRTNPRLLNGSVYFLIQTETNISPHGWQKHCIMQHILMIIMVFCHWGYTCSKETIQKAISIYTEQLYKIWHLREH